MLAVLKSQKRKEGNQRLAIARILSALELEEPRQKTASSGPEASTTWVEVGLLRGTGWGHPPGTRALKGRDSLVYVGSILTTPKRKRRNTLASFSQPSISHYCLPLAKPNRKSF